ncbi:hypothetical protein [Pararhodonellum marinum]|uniref:hypothetical protein n=1 Tax=Pararhodonellum marinum TaxID=2755358 RepID=UPI00188EF934|nr:hypothetical protein [Pararhodonellum marinum]
MKKSSKACCFLSIGLCLILLGNSCNYYKPVTRSVSASAEDKGDDMKSLRTKTFILRTPNGDFLLRNFTIEPKEQIVKGTLSSIPPEHLVYVNDVKKTYQYTKSQQEVLEEVHLYTERNFTENLGEQIILPVDDLFKLEIIERDQSRSTATTILSALVITLGVFALVMIIALLTKSSCPFISVYDGEGYALQGETFGGAIVPALAREDFLPLPLAHIGPEVKIMISNELKERQYTDLADLILVSHDPGEKIMMASNGKLYRGKNLHAPLIANLNQNLDMLFPLTATDNIACSFNDTDHPPVNELYLEFEKPKTEKELSLLLDLRNSYWLEYVIAEFYSAFGNKYAKFAAKQKDRSPEFITDWMESQEMLLTVEAKTDKGWKEVTKLKTIGPLMNREVAVPLEGFDLKGDKVEIRLRTGFMFWELDRINLAEVSPVSEQEIQWIKPSEAYDEHGQDVLAPILNMDGHYLEQHHIGNRAYLTYKVEDFDPLQTYAAFLLSKGYYEPIREFEGKADRKFLVQFKNPQALPSFSLKRYLEINQENYLSAQ